MVQSNLWIHGHTHSSIRARVGDDPEHGLIVCNPRGYPHQHGGFENSEFNPGLVVEI